MASSGKGRIRRRRKPAAYAPELHFDGLTAFRHAVFNPRYMHRFINQELGKAMMRNAWALVAAMRREIQSGAKFADNAPLTLLLKGGKTKPLVETSAMFQAFTVNRVSKNVAFAGILRRSGSFDVARRVHDGRRYEVTSRMRNAFFLLSQHSAGKVELSRLSPRLQELALAHNQWKPLKASTKFIEYPPRPFVDVALTNAAFARRTRQNWNMGLARALKRTKRKFEELKAKEASG